MKSRAAATILALTLGLSTLGTTSTQAAAAAKPCVTKAEYNRVQEGWSIARVHRTFGTAGKLYSSHRYDTLVVVIRNYPGCGSKYSKVTIVYNMWAGKDTTLKVGPGGKSAVWFT